MIVLCRIGETQAVANLIKSLVVSVYQEGGVIRRFVNLGDRIAQKSYKAKDGRYYSVTRYLSVHLDANPDLKNIAEKVALANSETLQVFTHKLKDRDYYKHMLNKEAWNQYEFDTEKIQEQDKWIKLAAKQQKDLNLDIDFKDIIEKEKSKSSLI